MWSAAGNYDDCLNTAMAALFFNASCWFGCVVVVVRFGAGCVCEAQRIKAAVMSRSG